MKARGAKRAKFRVGQVVCIRPHWQGQGKYYCIQEVTDGKDSPLYLFTDGVSSANEVAIRPLTAKERGK